jgi:hypothetical protein
VYQCRAAFWAEGKPHFDCEVQRSSADFQVKPSRVRSSTGHRSGHRSGVADSPWRISKISPASQRSCLVGLWPQFEGEVGVYMILYIYDYIIYIWLYHIYMIYIYMIISYIYIWLYYIYIYDCYIIYIYDYMCTIIIFTIIIYTPHNMYVYTIIDMSTVNAAASSQVWSQQHTSAAVTAGSGVLRELYGVWSWDSFVAWLGFNGI